jgi:hypothetical protein
LKGQAAFDAAKLRDLKRVPQEYGQALSSMLFSDEGIRSMFGQVKASAETANLALRVRLWIGPAALELHSLRWELLTGPGSDAYLFTSARVLFSRYMTSQDWNTVRLRPKADATALVAVSAPTNCDEWNLADVDRDGETKRAAGHLGAIHHPRTSAAHPSPSHRQLA